jgi:polysaccharide export outer membrane protein
MSDIIRSGGVGHCALAWVVLCGSLAVCLGQETTPPPPPPPTPADTTQSPANNVNKEPVKPADTAVPAPVVTQAPPAVTPAPAKGKAAKKGKQAPPGTGQPTYSGVQDKPYEIGPEDILYLNVLHQPDVTQNLEVRPDGFVSVRFAGEIKAAGLTSQQLADVITEKLKTYFNNPEVNIQVLKINSKKYYISGEVHRPGAYALTSPKTIYEALIEAGGPADFARQTKVYVLRGQEKIAFNYKDVSRGRNMRQNILLQNGDVIVVP